MTTMAIVGAGKGLGLAAARRFGKEGHAVALIARNKSKLDSLVSTLRSEGVTAEGFAADVRDQSSLEASIGQAAEQLGPIEVLQYSPVPAKEFMRPALDTAADDLVGPVQLSIYGPVTASRAVIPGMQSLGRGTILFINGASAVRPRGAVTGTSVAFAGESAYAQVLHEALAPEGIHVAQLIIPLGIGGGDADHEPDALADRLWRIHSERDEFRTFVKPLD